MAGVTAAIDYIADVGRHHSSETHTRREAIVAAYEVFQQHERELAAQLIRGLLAIPGLTFYGISDPAKADQRTPTVSIRMEGYSPRELAMELGERGIFTWDGNYYAINLAERLGVQQTGGMVRIGLAHYNTAEEVDRLLAELRSLAEKPKVL
jgi:selenocysteine lyase/cysteine desulfurase